MPWMAQLICPFFLGHIRGHAKLYDQLNEYGLMYFCLSVIMLLIWSDTLIYWIHREEHDVKYLYKNFHKLHHKFKLVTPYASFAFHPIDGFAQAFPYLLFPYFFHMQKWFYIASFFVLQLWTVSIHDGVHLSPFWCINGSAHHYLHHTKFNYNYGQYLTFWDRLCNTHMDTSCKWYRCVHNIYTTRNTNYSYASRWCRDWYYYWEQSTDKGLIPRQAALESILEHRILLACNRTCSLSGIVKYHIDRYRSLWNYGRYSNQIVGITNSSHKLYDFYWWDGLSKRIAIPMNTVCLFLIFPLNYQNLAVLRKLWQKDVGAAFYFHMFEIIFDFLLSFTIAANSMSGVGIGTTIDRWFMCCPMTRVISLGYCFLAFGELFNVLNQAFLLSMVADRLRAILNPMVYGNQNQKKVSGIVSALIIFFQFLLYFPRIFVRTCFYAEPHWMNIYPIYVNYIRKAVIEKFNYFHAFLLGSYVVGQIICSSLFYYHWEKRMRNRQAPRNRAEKQKIEKDKEKRDLLIGTVGLNIVLSVLTFVGTISGNLLNGRIDQWGVMTSAPGIFIQAVILPLFYFLNGTMAMVLHILFTKSYRKAFWKTPIGRVLAKVTMRPEANSSQTTGSDLGHLQQRQSVLSAMAKQREREQQERRERMRRSEAIELSHMRSSIIPGQIEDVQVENASRKHSKWRIVKRLIKSMNGKVNLEENTYYHDQYQQTS